MKHTIKLLSCLVAVLRFIAWGSPVDAQVWNTVGSSEFSAGAVQYTSMAIDRSGTPYVVYQDAGNSSYATVMKYNGSSWVTVGSAGFSAGVAQYTSIAINPSGTPYVVYEDGGNGNKATVMKYNGSSWVAVGSPGISAGLAEYTSIAIDTNSGEIYVAYSDGASSSKTTVMKYNGSAWATLGSAGFSGGLAQYTTIALDGSGTPYVAYSDESLSYKAAVMKYNGTSWAAVGSAAGFSAAAAEYTSIAIDAGTPYVAYSDGTSASYYATVMKYSGTTWVTVGTAGFSAGETTYESLAIDNSGTPYVAYLDYANSSKATVMKYNGTSWATVGSAGFSAGLAEYQSIAINGSGMPYVAYRDGSSSSDQATVMKYSPIIVGATSVCQGSTISLTDAGSSGTWSSSSTSVATVGSTGMVTGISAGTATISYAYGTSTDVTTITVNPYAPIVTEPAVICPGNTVTFTDAVSGGTWSSGNTAIGSVTSGGLVTGVSVGNVVISYSIPGGCVALSEVRVGSPIISTYAGTGTVGYTGDGAAATAATLNNPHGLSVDPTTGYIYIADDFNSVVRKIVPGTGIITTIAGTGTTGYTTGDIATAVELNDPFEVLADGLGNVYITDYGNNRVRKVNSSGIISTIAGNGTAGSLGDGGAATAAEVNGPSGIAMDASGNIYIGEINGNRVRMINTSGIISTFAGNGTGAFAGDNGPATAAELYKPNYVHIDNSGNLIISDNSNQRVRMVNSSGIITTIVGTGTIGTTGDGGAATAATLDYPGGFASDAAGNLYIAGDGSQSIRVVNTSGIITRVAGTTGVTGYTGNGGAATAATLHTPVDVTFDASGNMYIADQQNNVVRKVTTTAASVAAISGPTSVCRLSAIGLTDATTGGVWSSSNASVATVGTTGAVTGITAGTTTISYGVTFPCGVFYATQTVTVNPYAPITTEPAIICPGATVTLSDAATGGTWSSSNTAIATVTSGGTVTGVSVGNVTITYAVSGGCNAMAVVTVGSPIINAIAGTTAGGGYSGDGGAATAAQVNQPSDVITDASGNIYICDQSNNVVRKINTSGIITTIAGNGTASFLGDGGAATAAELNGPTGICLDPAGNLYIADINNSRIRKVNTSGIISTFAGTGTSGFSGDGAAATNAKLATPYGLVSDPSGNIYFTDYNNSVVRVVNTSGIINTIAGTATIFGYSGDGGPATAAEFSSLRGIAIDAGGNLYVAEEFTSHIRKFKPGGTISTFAGNGTGAFSGDGGAATAASINYPYGVSVDAVGNVFIADDLNERIREVNTSGIINTIAGNGTGIATEGVAATATGFYGPEAVWVDASENIYISDFSHSLVREITPIATGAPTAISGPTSVCVGSTISLTDGTTGGTWGSSNAGVAAVGTGGTVTGVSAGTATISYSTTNSCGLAYATQTVTVNANPAAITGASLVCPGNTITLGETATGGTWSSSNATIGSVSGGVVTGVSVGNVIISYTMPGGCYAFATIMVGSPIINTYAGGGTSTSDGVAATTAALADPTGIYIDGSDNIYIADYDVNLVRKVNAAGIITTVAGGGSVLGDNGPATLAKLTPRDVVMDGSGNLYVSDQYYQRVRKINTSGIITTVAGNGTAGFSGDGAAATNAALNNPWGVALDAAGNLYIADAGNERVRMVDLSGNIWTVAGSAGGGFFAGDGSAATNAKLNNPEYIRFDPNGNLIISDYANDCIRKVDKSTQIINTIVGTGGTPGLGGDGGAATAAHLTYPSGIIYDAAGNMYIADYDNNKIRVVNAATNTISTYAGNVIGAGGFSGDGGPATAAYLDFPTDVALDINGNLIISDLGNGRLRIVAPAGNAVASISGPTTVCVGSTIPLTDATTGGTWSSSASGVASVGTSGTVTGAGSGTAVITYSVLNGCGPTYAVQTVTVNASPASISPATATVCQFSTTVLTDATTGGTWSSSAPTTASVIGGTVTGVNAGSAIITYAIGSCISTATVTVNTAPTGITGAGALCSGLSATLTGNPTGGTWASSNTTVASIGSGSGFVTGATAGTTIITYRVTSGCYATATETITTAPSAISGLSAVCVGSAISLTDLPSGGTWSSSNVVAGTISSSGSLTGVSAGTTMVTYSLGTGCTATKVVTVNATPGPIFNSSLGVTSLCVGASTVFDSTSFGGAWTSSNASVLSIGALPSSGFAVGVAAGTATISYTLSDGCSTTLAFTVNPVPTAITGVMSVCTGLTTLLSSTPTGGTWSSGGPGATVNSGSGLVTGVTAGTVSISYSLGTGCTATTFVTVNPTPTAITGTTTLCTGGTSTLSSTPLGGSWTSSNSSVASIGSSSGSVTASTAGTAIITYLMPTGCLQTTVFTVNTAPSGITGIMSVCVGASTSFGNTVSGGTWSSSNTSTATIGSGSGIALGVAAGTSSITYSLGAGCVAAATLTVNANPAAITPPGAVSVCPGFTTTVGDITPLGNWSSSNTSLATVGSSSGTVSAIASGTVVISYTLATGCATEKTVTVNIAPATITPATPVVCVGGTTELNDGVSGGTWTSTATGTATIGSLTGIVNGIAAGTTVITYEIGTCYTTTTLTVSGLLSAGAITGASAMCVTTPASLVESATGGVWSSSNTSVATVSGAGLVSGLAAGTVVISYSVTNSCGTAVATHPITVSILSAGTITGDATLCAGTFTTYTDAAGSGSWSLANTNASIDASGFLTAITTGTDIITYSVTNTCGTATTSKTITIGAYLTAGSITGASSVCAGTSTTLTDPAPGGIWSASNSDASVSAGVVTGVSGGTVIISYTVSSSCGSTSAIQTVTVIPIPVAGTIVGPANICIGSSSTYTDAVSGGVWGTSNASVSITGGGLVTPVSVGSDILSYTVTNSCGSAYTTATVNIGAFLTAGSISGAGSVCVGASITLVDGATGGAWSASNGDAAVSGGTVTGVSAGTLTLSYTVTSACGTVVATHPVTVNPLPVAGSVSGPSSLCLGTPGAYLDGTTGGTWSLANATATISSGGVVTPVSAGTNIASYSVTNGCGTAVATENIAIGTSPTAGTIASPASLCTASPVTVTDGVPGGVWSVSNANATVSSAGLLTGIAAGTDIISYTVTNGCGTAVTTAPVSVNLSADPGVILGPSAICAGTFTIYTDTVSGGTWSCSNTNAAITSAGVLSALVPGSADTVIYTVSNACGEESATKVVTIGVLLTSGTITGPSGVCQGSSITLSDGTSGGVWASSNSSVAAVGTGTGIVNGISAGTSTISYVVTLSCGTSVSTATVTVSPTLYAGAILGATSVCVSSTITLVDPLSGGVWGSSNANATISGGVVTGVTAGVDTISYTISDYCGTASATKTITINPLPGTSGISGPASVCAGSSITLSDPDAGGVWTSSAPPIATVGAGSGLVSGVSGGTAIISYAISGSCGSTLATATVTVNALPLPGSITGPSGVCVGSLITLTDPAPGGAWSSANGNATITTGGVVTGITPGTDVINYTVSGVCGIAAATDTITISLFPVAGTISGVSSVCVGSAVTFTDGAGGGVWGSSNAAIATVGSLRGVVTGVASGADNISYTVTNACGSVYATATLTVNPMPVVAAITGSDSVCEGADLTLSDATPGGAWGAYNPNATVSVSGFVNGITPGIDTIEYSLTNTCGTSSAIQTITILPIPGPATISGSPSVCVGGSITLADPSAGGTWSASSGGVTVSGAGIVEGVIAGTATIYYTVTNICGSNTDSKVVTVNPAPAISPITGLADECVGLATTLDNATAGGAWASSNTAVATIGVFTGIVTGVSAGTATLSYSVTNTLGCTSTVFATDTVSLMPVVSAITGATSLCEGASITLSDAVSGGVWGSATTAIATVNPASGLVSGLTGGTDKIYYTVSNGCGSVKDSTFITVNAAPSAGAIAAAATALCSGSTVTLTDGVSGGMWGSNNTAVATVGSSGIATGVSAGSATITYKVTNVSGCTNTADIVLTIGGAVPSASVTPTGSVTLCHGNSVTMDVHSSSGTLAYQWSRGGSAISGASSSTYTTTTAGVYSVEISNGSCSADIAGPTVSAPPTPVITSSPPNELETGTFSTYQWYLNSVAIPGATTYLIHYTESGSYTVDVTDFNGCSDVSLPYSVSGVSGVNTVANNLDVKVYPNPAATMVHIEAPVTVNVRLLAIDGRILMDLKNATDIDVSNLAAGIYMVEVYDGNNILIKTAKVTKIE